MIFVVTITNTTANIEYLLMISFSSLNTATDCNQLIT
jgi:hypothetical protein